MRANSCRKCDRLTPRVKEYPKYPNNNNNKLALIFKTISKMPITHGSGRRVDLGLWALEKHRLLQGYLQSDIMRILCHLHTRGSLCLTLCTPREPGVPGVAGLQLSKFRHQPCLINSQRGGSQRGYLVPHCKKMTWDVHGEKQPGISLCLEVSILS